MWGFLRAFDKKLQELDWNYKHTFYCFSGDYSLLHTVCASAIELFSSLPAMSLQIQCLIYVQY